MTEETPTRWSPQTPEEYEIVRRQLNSILSSHHFKNSKRYPALLRYVVEKTLDGHSDQLKERTLGVEVFDRPPDYDTNADPVVRFSASEIRKRIAQFYHENGNESGLQIDLPLGSYVPEFKLKLNSAETHGEVTREQSPVSPVGSQDPTRLVQVWVAAIGAGMDAFRGRRTRTAFNAYVLGPMVLLIAVASLGAYALHTRSPLALSNRLWKPLLKPPGSVLIVIGNGPHGSNFPSGPEPASLPAQLHGPYNHISFCEAVALSRFADVLGKQSKAYQIKEADLTTLQDIRDRSVVLIGAYNNLWTMRLIQPLRFNFRKEGTLVWIADTRNPQNRDWAVDYTKPYSAAPNDYAIVARYVDPTTGGGILMIAGIGAYGTEAASESAATPHAIEKLLANVPSGWEDKNLEVVIKTSIINGEAGPPSLVSFATW